MLPRFITTLLPRRDRNSSSSGVIQTLLTLKPVQYAHFWVGWLAWTCDALDFFTVSLAIPLLAEQFGVSISSITTAITLTLLFRTLGAVIFGILSDRFGRKWPLVINLLFCCVFSVSSGFVKTYAQFLVARSLFGVALGGVWGLAASSALENLPVQVRGLASGVIQPGYSVGYLLAAVVNLTVVPNTRYTWRALFWFASGVTFLAAILRACLPESGIFLRAKALEKEKGTSTSKKTKVFLYETKAMLKTHWKLCVYAILLMSGLSFLTHGSQDLYPTYLEITKGFSSHDATIATIIGNCGAIVGSVFAGYISQYIGRRLTIVIMVLFVGALIPLWILPDSFGLLSAGAFFLQFGVQGALGVIPIQLAELSPPGFRATFPGLAYQLGIMVSAASSQIEATGGSHLKTTIFVDGQLKSVDNYAKVQGIFIGTVAVYVVLMTIFGPENHSSHFEKHKTAFEEGGGQDDAIIVSDSIHEDEKASEV